MKICIKGYKNLENLELDLTDNKINMIFGMSGSGKSSISGALNDDECERNKTFGLDIEQLISVNDYTELPLISSYNKKTISEYVIEKNNDEVYQIFIDSETDVKKAEKSLSQMVANAENALMMSREKYNLLSNIKKDIGSDLNRDMSLRKSAKILSFEQSLQQVKSISIVKEINELPPKKLDWYKAGILYIDQDEKLCPFCEKKISNKRMTKLNKITTFESKAVESIKTIQSSRENDIFEGIDLTLKGIEKTKKQLIDIIIALKQYDQIVDSIDQIKKFEYNNWSQPFQIGFELKTYFPEVYNAANKVLKNIRRLQRVMEDAHNNTKSVLSRRLNKINKYLMQMSIPYKIQAEYANNKIKSYRFIHINDNSNEDRSDALSEGERCIVSLLLFIFRCKKENSKLIIIDDPASSYDDFRRSQIFKIIQNELKGQTILILSHDNVFAKYAVVDKYNTDKIYYFENYGDQIKLTNITKNDFGDFNEFVFDRLHSMTDYYQKIINLRMLFEDKHNTYAYGYLSAILHKTPLSIVEEELSKKNTTEEHVIEMIKNRYKELEEIDIPKYSDDITINTSEYSIIEKGIWARENFTSELNKENLVDELNEFAHINSKLKICLNPYKFTFCTKRLYNYLNELNIS